jgi:hypothetical protein
VAAGVQPELLILGVNRLGQALVVAWRAQVAGIPLARRIGHVASNAVNAEARIPNSGETVVDRGRRLETLVGAQMAGAPWRAGQRRERVRPYRRM